MGRDTQHLVPVSLAVLLHVVILASMVIGIDYARPTPMTPLIVQATLVEELPQIPPPKPEPVIEEPEPEPVIEEPEPDPEPEPDDAEEQRRQAEEEKRRQDALLEQKRLEEQRKQEEEARKRKEREEAERKKREEEEKERKRVEAERKRQEDIRRQREENERLRRELEAEQRAREIEDEARRIAAENSPEMAAYQYAISQKIHRSWSVPASAKSDTECVVNVRQIAGGEIIGVNIVRCSNADDAVRRSVEAAVRRASPLPAPSNPDLFRAELRVTMRPESLD